MGHPKVVDRQVMIHMTKAQDIVFILSEHQHQLMFSPPEEFPVLVDISLILWLLYYSCLLFTLMIRAYPYVLYIVSSQIYNYS